MSSSTLEFLEILYPRTNTAQPRGFFSLWEMPGKTSAHFDTSVPSWRETVAEKAQQWDSLEQSVYYGVCLRDRDCGIASRGLKKNIISAPGVWADFDLAPEGSPDTGHAASNLPSSIADIAEKVLVPFGVEPSLVVSSGGGLHVYWLLDATLYFSGRAREEFGEFSRKWQSKLYDISHASGWHLDTTSDLARVLRPAGTHNRKLSQPRPVEILGTGGRYSYTELKRLLAEKASLCKPTATVLPGEELEDPQAGQPSTSEIMDMVRSAVKGFAKKDSSRTTICKAILSGEPFAEPGERDSVIYRVASWITFRFPEEDPEILAEVIRPSYNKMAELNPEILPWDSDRGEDSVIRKFIRAQGDSIRKYEEERQRNEAFRQALIKGIPAPLPGKPVEGSSVRVAVASQEQEGTRVPSNDPTITENVPLRSEGSEVSEGTSSLLVPGMTTALALMETAPEVRIGLIVEDVSAVDSPEAIQHRGIYTPSEIVSFGDDQAKRAKVAMGLSEWRKRWIIQAKNAFYVYVDGYYKAPVSREELDSCLVSDLSPMPTDYLSRYINNKDGAQRRRSTSDILLDICTVARSYEASMLVERSYYSPSDDTFYEAACPKRNIEAVRDERVEKWLALLGGANTEKLLDWLATITRQDEPAAALMVTGRKSAGKTMLALGLSRLWSTSGFCPMSEAAANWNASMLKSPLVVADEYVPSVNGRDPISTQQLRDLISSESRELRRKFLPNMLLRGCGRYLFLSNGEDMLHLGDETLGVDSLSAVALRFLHIAVTEEATKYLEEIGGRSAEGTAAWVNDDIIAKHVTWLSRNRSVAHGNRFIVEGQVSTMHQKFAMQSPTVGFVLEFLARIVSDKNKAYPSAVFIKDGKLWANAGDMLKNWELVVQNDRKAPTMVSCNKALAAVAMGTEQVYHSVPMKTGKKDAEKRQGFWEINTDMLIRWATDNGIGDPSEMRHTIATRNTLESPMTSVGAGEKGPAEVIKGIFGQKTAS